MKLSDQIKSKILNSGKMKRRPKFDGDTTQTISTGSTLLDLAILGGRKRGGGIPGGIFVEIFGPSGSGKTVLLCEIAGGVKRDEGEIMFHDPEARLNKQFAKLFDLDVDKIKYTQPDTIPQVFDPIRKWKVDNTKINGIFADSLAALSTDLEMDNKDGDKMGTRRGKEFSEGLRKTCRILPEKNLLLVASNQIRDNIGVTYGPKQESPGGWAIKFYSSLRLKLRVIKKIVEKKMFRGKEVIRQIGVRSEVEVWKSSVWAPGHKAPISIYFDYGIDDIRENLQFIKDYSGISTYTLNGKSLDKSMSKAIKIIEEDDLERKLKREVIKLWEEIEEKFKVYRKEKRR